MACLGSGAVHGTSNGLPDRFDLHDVLFHDRIRREWFHGVMFHAETIAAAG